MNFIWLMFAHYIGDSPMQTKDTAENKSRRWYTMLVHCMIWSGMVCMALKFLGLYVFWKAIFLIVFHGVIDSWKSRVPKTPENWKYVYVDQGLHIIQLLVVYNL